MNTSAFIQLGAGVKHATLFINYYGYLCTHLSQSFTKVHFSSTFYFQSIINAYETQYGLNFATCSFHFSSII